MSSKVWDREAVLECEPQQSECSTYDVVGQACAGGMPGIRHKRPATDGGLERPQKRLARAEIVDEVVTLFIKDKKLSAILL